MFMREIYVIGVQFLKFKFSKTALHDMNEMSTGNIFTATFILFLTMKYRRESAGQRNSF